MPLYRKQGHGLITGGNTVVLVGMENGFATQLSFPYFSLNNR